MRGGPGGTGLRGGVAGTDTPPVVAPGRGNSLEYYKVDDPGGPYNVGAPKPMYVAGVRNFFDQFLSKTVFPCDVGSFQGGGAGDALYAIPERFGYAGTIVRLVNKYMGGGPAGAPSHDGFVRMGIYTNRGIGDYYPDQLLADTGDLRVDGTVDPDPPADPHDPPASQFLGAIGGDNLLEVAVPENSLLWFVFTANGEAQSTGQPASVLGVWDNCFEPILGGYVQNGYFDGAVGRDSESFGIGWRVPSVYGPLPQQFPAQSGASRLVSDSEGGQSHYVPAIYYGFQNA